MKLVDFKEEYGVLKKKETDIPLHTDDTYYKIMDLKFNKGNEMEYYANFGDAIIIDDNSDTTKIIDISELNENNQWQLKLDLYGEENVNNGKLHNLIYNKNLLNKQTRKYKLKNVGESIIFGASLALPVATGLLASDQIGVVGGIITGGTTFLGEIAIFNLFTDGNTNYGEDYQKQKQLSKKINHNSSYLDQAYIKKMLLESNIYKEKANLIRIEYLNSQRNKLLHSQDEFSECAETYLRARKK